MSETSEQLTLPPERGPLSAWVIGRLIDRSSEPPPFVARGTGLDDDLQLALYLCYESHYSALPDVGSDHEWDPAIIAFRQALEASFEASLSDLVGRTRSTGSARDLVADIVAADDGPSLSRYMEHVGTLEQMREFVIQRSAYQLKEGDPHTFAIPRLRGRAKQLLTTVQVGEYGADGPGRAPHAALFAQTMRCLGLDERHHAYLEVIPASALAVSNLISLFGLNRRWRGALVGHLAVFEMTSVVPMGRYSRALERMGGSPDARRFYEVHVLADAEHEIIALDMVAALAEEEPSLVADITFGALSVLEIETRFAEHLLAGWRQEVTPRVGTAA